MAILKFCWFIFITFLVEYSSQVSSDVYRLPNDAVPISYDLRVAPNLENWRFDGEVNIKVHVKFTTDRIILHSRYLEIRNITVKKSESSINGTANHTATYEEDEDNKILIIKTGKEFQYNTDYDVSITFHGDIAHKSYRDSFSMGFYHGYNKGEVAAHNEATGARSIFPCFDEPRFRAPFTISVARPENYTVVSNMPSEAILPPDSLSGGLMWEKFKPTPPMPTYMVAIVVSRLETLNNDDGRMRVLTTPELVSNASYALKQADKLLKYFEGYLGISYGLPKLDLVTVSKHPAYAMENWGLITFREDILLLQDNSSAEEKELITTVISHEFAHLWFGDMVTIPWYDYLWLKEGFASYFQYFGAAAVEPSWDIESSFVVQELQDTLSKDIGEQRPMTAPIRTFYNIPNTYDEISNAKGACVIRMFEFMLSTSTFKNALHNYLKNGQQNQNGVTTPRNLFDAFDQQVELDSLSHLPSHVSASDIMKTWTENEGYPVINVARSDKGEVVVTQDPFKARKSAKQTAKWIVPLTYTTKSQPEFSDLVPTHWSFADNPTVLSGFDNNSKWVLFNLKQSGYYRVNYDKRNWQLLIYQLLGNHTVIHPLNRAQLIDDITALAADGKVQYSLVFSLLTYLEDETDLVPWYSAISSYNVLMRNFDLTGGTSFMVEDFFKRLLKKPLKQIGCNVSPKDDHTVQILKSRFIEFVEEIGLSCTPT